MFCKAQASQAILPKFLFKVKRRKKVFCISIQITSKKELASIWLSTSNFSTVPHISFFFELERIKVCLLKEEQKILFASEQTKVWNQWE